MIIEALLMVIVMKEKKLLINLAGINVTHEIVNKSECLQFYEFFDFNIKAHDVDITSESSVFGYVVNIILKPLLLGYGRKYRRRIESGNYELLFSEMTPVIVILIVVLHAITGKFPTVRWLYEVEGLGGEI